MSEEPSQPEQPIDSEVQESPRLSVVSKMHDKGEKGYLDDIEQEMRRRDTKNLGQLTPSQARLVTEDLLESKKQRRLLQNWTIVLAILLIMSTVANIGTAYLAVSLNKDTEPDSNGVLQTIDGNKVVSTQSIGLTVELNLTYSEDTGEYYSCISIETAAEMWHGVQHGTRVVISEKHDSGSNEMVQELTADGSTSTPTEISFSTGGTTPRRHRVLFGSALCDPNAEDANEGESASDGASRRLLFEEHLENVSKKRMARRLSVPGVVVVPIVQGPEQDPWIGTLNNIQTTFGLQDAFAGDSVAMTGDSFRYVVSSRERNGVVRVFSSSSGTQVGSDISAGDAERAARVAISASAWTAVVAASTPGSSSSAAGFTPSVSIRTWNGASSTWEARTSIIASAASTDSFGMSLAMNGDGSRVAVGDIFYNNGQGAVHVYDWDGSSWSMPVTLTSGRSDGLFGYSMAMSEDGNRLVIGAPARERVHTFNRGASSWVEISTRKGSKDSSFGASVSISKDGLALAVGESEYKSSKGRVWTFKYGPGKWDVWGERLLGLSNGESCGHSVAISDPTDKGARLAYGCPTYVASGNDPAAPPNGRFYHYFVHAADGAKSKTGEVVGTVGNDGRLGNAMSMSSQGYDMVVTGNHTSSRAVTGSPTATDYTNGASSYYTWVSS